MKPAIARRISFAAFAAAFAFAAAAPAQAAGTERMFKTTGVEKRATRTHFKRSQRIQMNKGALTRPRLGLNLLGEDVTAIRDHIDRNEDGTISWVGHISGSPSDRVVITGRRGTFAGRIDFNGRLFEISRERGGELMINEVDLAALPEEEPFHLPMSPDGGPVMSGAQKTSTASSGDAIQQDLLVAYTDDACRANGGNGSTSCSQIEAKIVNAVADMNAAYAASGVNITVNLVGMVATNYDEGDKSASDMLNELRRTTDGQIDELHNARNDYGADLLALVTGSGGGYCGIAFVGSSSSSAMSVTAEFCLSNRTLAHEIGHNQGSSHARSQNNGGTSGAYHYGYRRCDDDSVDDVGAPYFSTIMAYSCRGAARIGGFSNPNINYQGAPTGIDPDDDADNGAWAARTLNESASAIANFRSATTPPPTPTSPPAPPPTPPSAPSSLVASASDNTVVRLSWSDNADNETRYVVRRALDGGQFTTIAFLPRNTERFTDNGLNPSTIYRYRVRATNAAGQADSNLARIKTPTPRTLITDRALKSIYMRRGRISGSYRDTHRNDGRTQRITEVNAGVASKPGARRGEHAWVFDVAGGRDAVFTVNAYVSGAEGFKFSYKRPNDRRWSPMFTVDSKNAANIQQFTLPDGSSGRLLVRARDAVLGKSDRTDTLSIDYMAVMSDPSADGRADVFAGTPVQSTDRKYELRQVGIARVMPGRMEE